MWLQQADCLNLAQPLNDGEGIYIPLVQDSELETVCTAFASFTTAASSTQNSTTTSTEQSQQTSTKTSVNTASEKQLTSLPGIGEVRAAAIVAGRPYASFEELVSKEVLTQKLFDGLADLIEL